MSFVDHASGAADILAGYFQKDLQARLGNAGWEHDIDVVAEDGQINIQYKERDSDEIFNSEYGFFKQAPNSVLRGFVKDAQGAVQPFTEAAAVEYIFSQGLV